MFETQVVSKQSCNDEQSAMHAEIDARAEAPEIFSRTVPAMVLCIVIKVHVGDRSLAALRTLIASSS